MNKLTINTPTTPSTLLIKPENKIVMRIERDKIWVDPDVEVTEAAEKVLDAMRHMMNGWYKQVWNEAIEAAAKLVEERFDSCEPWLEPHEMRELKK